MLTAEEIYEVGSWYRYPSTLGYDMTEMLNFRPNRDFKNLMLLHVMYHTFRNFQEPALRFFKIKGRTKLIKKIRNTNFNCLIKIVMYKIVTGSDPNDIATVDSLLKIHGLDKEYGYRCHGMGPMPDLIKDIEAICSVLNYTSIYEWTSMFCNDQNNNLNSLLGSFKQSFNHINKMTGKNMCSMRQPFNLIVTDHESLANKLIVMGERPNPSA